MQSNLFPDDTLHKTFLNLYRGQTLAGQYALDRTQTTATLDAPREATTQVVLTFIREGVRHIFIGPDHILFVLALTSNRFSIRKLGRKWSTLHRLAYVAAALGTLHFWQLVKADTTEPWRWAAGFALLFAIRVWWAYRPRFASIPNSRLPTANHSQLPTSKRSQS